MFRLVALSVISDLCIALPQYSAGSADPATAALVGLTDGLNFPFTSSATPEPFTIDVDPSFIATTSLKAELYRPSRNITEPDWSDGPTTSNISDIAHYWAQNYSWFDYQSYLNDRYSQYTTTVDAGPNFTDPVHLHFAHQRSNRSDAIPLLLLHGWPSSFAEWDAVVDGLTSPPNASLPAFHAVAPDLPGFGFSPAPTTTGFGSREAGHAMDNLMKQLGYDKYAIYVTDLGSFVGQWMVHDAADSIISRLTDFYFVAPNADDMQRYAANQTTPQETTFINNLNNFQTNDSGYIAIHTTRPLSLTEALTDSPVGFLAWMWELRHHVSGGHEYTAEELINDAMMLYIQGTYGNVRSYKEFWFEGALNDSAYPSSNVPTGVGHWHSGPDDLNDPFNAFAPDSWIRRNANLTFSVYNDVGNHFAATSAPQQWLEVTRQFFGNASASGLDRLK